MPKVLDIDGMHATLVELGFNWSRDAVRKKAVARKIPCFKAEDGKLYIFEDELLSRYRRMQNESIKQNKH